MNITFDHTHTREVALILGYFLNNLPCDKHNVDIIMIGKGNFSMRLFNGYIQKNKKQIPQNLFFRCGMTHLSYSL